MENLNAEQIIKAFDVCRDKDLCNECPYEENIDCLRLREKHAIALMKSQEQRIKELTEENEMLRAENENKCKDCAGCLQWKCDCANIEAQAKSDTVRKMQKALEQIEGVKGEK